jgi:cytochrome c biogenesis protein CcdA
MISEDPHLLARISGVFVAAIGGFVLVQPYLPHVPNPFHMPKVTWDRVRKWMLHGTSPAAAISGFVVGLCTFPCSGGIYVAILSLLAAKTTYTEGLGYLYLYNLAFILPLVLVLVVVSNKAVARRATAWERGHTSLVRAVAAVAMIAVGVLTLLLV